MDYNHFIEIGKNLFNANLISFCVMIYIFYLIGKKFNVLQALEQCQLKIKETIELSEEKKSKSFKLLQQAQKEIEALPLKIEKMQQDAQNTGAKLAENIKEKTAKKIQTINSNNEKLKQFEFEAMKGLLTKDISLASLKIAQDNIKDLLNNNYDLHKQIVNQCIDEI